MKKLFLILLCFSAITAKASHIVGGELELLHLPNGIDGIERYNYRLNLIYYYDVKNSKFTTAPEKAEPTLICIIYRKSDGRLMRSVQVAFLEKVRVDYTQPACSIAGVIITDRLTYTAAITLSPNDFADPEGYYVVWERCCRNYQIRNIFSDVPNTGGIAAGQTFYLKFPPVTRNGQPFINSSPHLFRPLSDYACPNKPYNASFSGTDEDGDSIAYSLTTPLTTSSADAMPVVTPEPYPLITWRPPFSLGNIMGGNPDLKISKDGFIRVTPGIITGLFVFAVKCEEYRNGEKIGETRRDFQIYVSDSCPDEEAPQITGKKLNSATYTNVHQPLSVKFDNTVLDGDRCIEVQVYDPDALKATQAFQEKILIRAIPLNFKADISGILPSVTSATLTKHDSVKSFTLCFKDCPYIEGPFQIGIIAYDDACAVPLSDTLRVTVDITPPPNRNPIFDNPVITEVVAPGSGIRTWQIHGYDLDGDSLMANIIPFGFDPAKVGMTIDAPVNKHGDYRTALHWDTDCSKYDFGNKTTFKIKISIEDKDHCEFKHPAIKTFDLTFDDHNAAPVISASLTTRTSHRYDSVTFTVFEKPALTFNVAGSDVDNDLIVLTGAGKNFKMTDYGMTFNGAQGSGYIASSFNWPINCDNVKPAIKNKFDIEFIVVDNKNICHIYKADTLDVNITIRPAVNTKPQLSIASMEAGFPLINNSLSTTIGQQISLGLYATDVNNNPADFLKIEVLKSKGNIAPEGYVFQPHNGYGVADALFNWLPDCSIFKNGIYENNYNFSFRVTDNRCDNVKGDTVDVNLTVKDIDYHEKEFLPPNFISPNGDGLNEYFAMEGIDVIENNSVELSNDPNQTIALPKDNCARQFESIKIYNRWGKEIFKSDKRNFRWYAHDAAAGVYFYTLTYTSKIYKGSISVRE